MKKEILRGIFILISILSFSNLYAVKASMKSSFNTALNKVVGDSNNLQTDIIQNYNAWRLKYYNSNIELSAFGITEMSVNGYISLTLQGELNNGYGYQCVGFIKATTNLGSTSTWKKGVSVSPFNLPSRGDIIAIFDNNGNYDYGGHVAIVLSASNTHIYVIDQNWEGTGTNPVGKVIIHAIPFSGTGNANADNYSIVEY